MNNHPNNVCRPEEHHEIKSLAYDADSTTAGPDFDRKLEKAFQAFDTHAREEEEGILTEMDKKLTPEEKDVGIPQTLSRTDPFLTHLSLLSQKEARNFLKARKMAPPRAHPAAPQSGGISQKIAGMHANVHDKIINTVRGTDYVNLKEQHPESFWGVVYNDIVAVAELVQCTIMREFNQISWVRNHISRAMSERKENCVVQVSSRHRGEHWILSVETYETLNIIEFRGRVSRVQIFMVQDHPRTCKRLLSANYYLYKQTPQIEWSFEMTTTGKSNVEHLVQFTLVPATAEQVNSESLLLLRCRFQTKSK